MNDKFYIVVKGKEPTPVYSGTNQDCQQYVQDMPQTERGQYQIKIPNHD